MSFLCEWLFGLSSGQVTNCGLVRINHTGQNKSVRLWNALLVCWLFKKGENTHLWKCLCQLWGFSILSDREYLRGSRELESYAPGILFYVEIKPATSKYRKIRL